MSLAHYMVCSNERICIAMWLNNEDKFKVYNTQRAVRTTNHATRKL